MAKMSDPRELLVHELADVLYVEQSLVKTLPKLATDGAGYVQTVPPSAAALLAQPAEVGAFQAAVVDDGPASPAATANRNSPGRRPISACPPRRPFPGDRRGS